MMENESLKAAIDIGAAKNLVIFDSQAKPAELTERLISLINNYLCNRLTAIIICETTQVPNEVLMQYRDLAIFRINESTWRQLYSYYYSVLWGALANDDVCLIIGIDERFDFVLGSY